MKGNVTQVFKTYKEFCEARQRLDDADVSYTSHCDKNSAKFWIEVKESKP